MSTGRNGFLSKKNRLYKIRRALLISDGSPKIFFSSVFCWIFIALIVLVIFGILRSKVNESKAQPNKEET